MYYIENVDKPKIFDRIFRNVKLENNRILISNFANKDNEKKTIKMAKKTNQILEKAKSNKIVLCKEVKENKTYVNLLNSYGYYIVDGKVLFEILINNILNIIVNKNNIKKEETQISLLTNSFTEYVLENIKILANEYKTINIVTNHIEKFKTIEKKIYDNYGLMITITNNKKKSLLKSKLIINIDFPNELVNKYNILDEAIIIDIRGDIKISKKRFNGVIIKDYEIKTSLIEEDKKYSNKELYEAKLYPSMKFNEVYEKIKNDNLIVKALFGCNGEIL